MHFRRLTSPMLLGLLLVALSPALLRAQPATDPYNFSNIPVDEYGSSNAYVGFGGGFAGLVMLPNYDGINSLASRASLPGFEGPFVMLGGGGFGSALLVDNMRIGAYGFSGSKSVEDTVAIGGTPYNRSMTFAHGLTAGGIDYAIRLGGGFTLVPGIMLGASTYTLQTAQSQEELDASNLLPGAGDPNTFTSRVTSDQLFYYPNISLEWVVLKYMMLRVGAGYSGVFVGSDGLDWRDGNDHKVNGMPDISTNGATFQFGIYVGFFQLR